MESIFVAETSGGLAGTACFSLTPYGNRVYGLRGNVVVVPEFRRQGIGKALLDELGKEVRLWQVERLFAWRPTAYPQEQTRLLSWGFQPEYHNYTFEIFSVPTIAALAPKVEKLRAHKKIPTDLIIAPLRTLDIVPASSLYAQFYGMDSQQAQHRLNYLLRDERCARYSIGITQNGLLLGLIVWDGSGEVPSVDLLAVSPSWKSPSGPLLLLYESVRIFFEAGEEKAHYKCSDAVSFSLQIARLSGAKQVKDEVAYSLDLRR
ncbi:GNAT family N-acetyltransferase [Bradyrhizobium paxllaeri]|uniref:GNAT family N-acetyltransferase n=1 Tax=Bradyrhizobium paxllaeri TaxID=190148 RepID=UPI000827C750|nr:GNAT family N-acetyltransferase [Bradyrhizobium paxllaeri]